jgi:hypothetical protein
LTGLLYLDEHPRAAGSVIGFRMNVGRLIVEGAWNGIGFALGTIILGAVFAVLAFLAV